MLMDMLNCSRIKACVISGVGLFVLSLPCALGFNLWSGFTPFTSASSVMDLEDFLVSNVLLPAGSICYVLFCVSKKGWGFDNFILEANTGKGLKLKKWMKPYLTFVLPTVIIFIFIYGLVNFEFRDNFTILNWFKNLF